MNASKTGAQSILYSYKNEVFFGWRPLDSNDKKAYNKNCKTGVPHDAAENRPFYLIRVMPA